MGGSAALAKQRICSSRIPQQTRVRSRRAAATLAMFLASFPRRAMMASLMACTQFAECPFSTP
jgi:hypothetical protein